MLHPQREKDRPTRIMDDSHAARPKSEPRRTMRPEGSFQPKMLLSLIIAELFVMMAPSLPAASENRPVPTLASPLAANTNLPELSKIIQIRDLSPQEASRGYPVRVTGVLTHNDPFYYLHFVEDDSAGIYLDLSKKKFDALPGHGKKVEIWGFSGPGGYAPVLHAERIRVVGESPFPSPKASTFQMLMTGNEDSQWVALKGVVRNQSVENNHTILALSTGDAVIKATVAEAVSQPAPRNFIDAAVEIRGVCTSIFDEHRRLRSVELHVPNWAQIHLKEIAPEDPFTLPVRPINELLQYHAGGHELHRSRSQGIVTLRQADGSFFVQDATGGIHVQAKESASKIQVGAAIEIAAFPAVADELPVLQDAILRPWTDRGSVGLIEATHLAPEFPLDEVFHATLVRLEARVVGHAARTTEEILTVEFGQCLADAILEKEGAGVQLAKILPGSVVRLTGVYVARLDDGRKIQSFQLRLRSSADVVVLTRPPWWTARRTLWVLGGVGMVFLVSLGLVGLSRNQVRQRTRELREEIDGHKRTETKLEAEIAERKRMEIQMEQAHQELLGISRQAGMAEVATSVLHNVGNVLNSVNVASSCLADSLRKSKAVNLSKVVALMREHETDLGVFITSDPKGKQLPGYLAQLAEHLNGEQAAALTELILLQKNIDHIKQIVTMQQSFAKVSGVAETLPVTDLVEDALRMNSSALARHDVHVIKEFEEVPPIMVEKHKVLQILVNLLHNGMQACGNAGWQEKRLTLRVTNGADCVRIVVSDNGVGISPENLTRIFGHGFTTKKDGHGFGLHSGALAAQEMGGSLSVQSDGPGKGATFTLELPFSKKG